MIKPEKEEPHKVNIEENMKKDITCDANKMSLEELEDYLCLEESSDSDDSGIEMLEESSVSEIDSEESLDSNIGKASLEGEDDKENACSNSLDSNFELKKIQYQNDTLLFRLEKLEQNEDSIKREMEELNNIIINSMVVKKMKLKEEEWMRKENECKEKLDSVEKALSVKTSQLLECL